MKLHVGCGRHVLDGWVNVDVQRSPKAKRDPEILADIRSIPLADGIADELMAIHVIEHVYIWEAVEEVLPEWFRLLRPGGRLVLELPDVMKAARNLIEGKGDQMSMWPIYGDWNHRDPYMMHRHGYTFATLRPILQRVGFVDVREGRPQWHGSREARDFRAEARKP